MNANVAFDGRIPEEMLDLNDLGIPFAKLAEALMIEDNVPVKRRFTHDELVPAIEAIRKVRAQSIDRQMMEAISK